MKKQLLFLLLTAMVAFTSCKKDNDDDNGTGGSGSTKLLKRIIETEDGETTTFDFTYDANKRVTQFKSTDNVEVTNFTYDGNGNLTKIENKDEDSKNVFEFTYTNGKPVTGVFKSYEWINNQQGELTTSYKLDYTVTNDKVTGITMVIEEEGEDDIEVDYELTYTNGNLTKVQTVGSNMYMANYTYGNKKPVFPAAFKYILDPGGMSVQFYAKNDLLTTTVDAPGTIGDYTITNQYTYDSNGYVLTSTDGDATIKYEYQ